MKRVSGLFEKGKVMDVNRLAMPSRYGVLPAGAEAGGGGGMARVSERSARQEDARAPLAALSAASTRVSLSAAGQSRLAAEQQNVEDARAAARQSAAVPQNMPVQNANEADRGRNEAASFTAAAPAPAVAARLSEPAPGGGAPLARAAGGAASSLATPAAMTGTMANAGVGAAQDTPRDMTAGPSAALPTGRSEAATQERQSRTRQDVQAQARQDVSPTLAQSGLGAYRQVLSL